MPTQEQMVAITELMARRAWQEYIRSKDQPIARRKIHLDHWFSVCDIWLDQIQKPK